MPAQPLLPEDPRRLGEFMLVGRLGEGGQGIVYLGLAADGRQVAVKVLKTGSDRSARERLAQEIAAAMRVRPFCTARVLTSSVDAPQPYIVSEYVDGPSLQDRVAQRGRLVDGDLDRLIVNTTTALAAIHSARIVHRDLKPANVLLGPDGPRVVDFGISRPADQLTMTGRLIGTPAYFSPEQLRRRPATAASDVFAWAGTMVFAATGHPPFDEEDIATLFTAILEDEPDLSGVPAEMRPLLAACLDKEPANRPTAKDLINMLLDAEVGVEPGDDVDPGFTAVVQLLDHAGTATGAEPGEGTASWGPGEAGEAQEAEEAGEAGEADGLGGPHREGSDHTPDGPSGDHGGFGGADRKVGDTGGTAGPDPHPDPAPAPAPDPEPDPRDDPPAPNRRHGAPHRVRAHETVEPYISTQDTDPTTDPAAGAGALTGTRADASERPSPPEPVTPLTPPARTPAATRRKLGIVVAAVVTTIVVAALTVPRLFGGSGQVIPAEYGGRWTGEVSQNIVLGVRMVQATIELDAGGTSGRFETAGCDDKLTLDEVTPTVLQFTQTPASASTSGECPSGGVRIHVEGDVLSYHLISGDETAQGNLRRQGAG